MTEPPLASAAFDTGPQCLDARGVADALRVSVRSIRRLDDAGKLPEPLRLGGSKRWLAEDIHDWLRAGAPPRRQWSAMRKGKS